MNVLGQNSGKNWTLFHGDCCEVIKGISDNSIDISIFSPPFSQLYIYSDSVADMGNSADHEEFFEHYRYLVGELLRVTKPGRLCVVHCKDLPLYKGRDGAMGLYDFPSDISVTHTNVGWTYHSRVTIWKDPVTEMQRTKNHGLLYKELCKDSCGSRQGMADYLLVFRKWGGEFKDPVCEGRERFSHYIGLEPPDPNDVLGAILDYEGNRKFATDKWGRWPSVNPFPIESEAYRIWSIKCWQKYASPVWFDVNQMDVLNKDAARIESDEKHICPLQLDVIGRCIHLWTNPGDVVFSPFAGIGSELHVALKSQRKAVGIELKESYFEQASNMLASLEADLGQPSLFDQLEMSHESEPSTVPTVSDVQGDRPSRKRKGKATPVSEPALPGL